METANILLSLGGDSGNQVPKFGVTAAEIAVLRLIHGEGAVTDIEPGETLEDVSDREERERLALKYAQAKIEGPGGQKTSVVDSIYPGAAAHVFRQLDELDIPEEFFKAETRVKPKTRKKAKPRKTAKQKSASSPLD